MSPSDTAAPLRLQWSAISDVGRVRKDNQDSGYAGPWLLTVCDGVGGAMRGDIASSVAVQQLRRLDDEPPGPLEADDLLGRDRKSTRLNSSHTDISRMPSSA